MKKLNLKKIKVQSFVTEIDKGSNDTNNLKGGFTGGNCLSVVHVTCPDPSCDFKSWPVDECMWTHYQNGCPSVQNTDCAHCAVSCAQEC